MKRTERLEAGGVVVRVVALHIEPDGLELGMLAIGDLDDVAHEQVTSIPPSNPRVGPGIRRGVRRHARIDGDILVGGTDTERQSVVRCMWVCQHVSAQKATYRAGTGRRAGEEHPQEGS